PSLFFFFPFTSFRFVYYLSLLNSLLRAYCIVWFSHFQVFCGLNFIKLPFTEKSDLISIIQSVDSGHFTDAYKYLKLYFLNKKRFMDMLDTLPEYAVVEINGSDSVYIDRDILEILHDYKSKAHRKHIELKMINIPDVETIELH